MELKSRSFTSKEPHVAREPQVADPWTRQLLYHATTLDTLQQVHIGGGLHGNTRSCVGECD
jgi:hypothetical protein